MKPKLYVLPILFLLANSSIAQTQAVRNIERFDTQYTLIDPNGMPLNRAYNGIEGFPFVLNEFKYGQIEMKNGRKFTDVKFRLNILSHQVHFMSPEKEEGSISGEFIKNCSFTDSTQETIQRYEFRSDLPAIDEHKSNEFCQILSDGKIVLLKTMNKRIETRKNEFSGEITKEFALYEDLFSYQNGEMKRFKKDKEFILNLMQDKRALMEAYFKANKGNLKNQQYLAGIFQYYNSL
jgi:hypothetical protein